MNVDDVLLMILEASPNGVPGKTAIQKIGYFCSERLHFDMGYYAHYYGPYSRIVEKNLQSLKDFDFIKIEQVPTRKNRNMYKIELNNDGKEIVSDLIKTYSEQYKTINEVVNICLRENMDYNILSYAAKIYYILKEEKGKLSTNELIELASYHDWKLSPPDIDSATTLLTTFGVQISPIT